MTIAISVVAADRKLVTAAEVSEVISDPVSDTMIIRASDLVSMECRVVGGGVTPPTLRQETIIETVRLTMPADRILLSRGFIGEISSLTVDGTALASSEYEVDKSSGILIRLDGSDNIISWDRSKIIVTYTAGFATVPEPLKLATIRVIQEQLWGASTRDPFVSAERVGPVRVEYFRNDAAVGGISISAAALTMLAPYRRVFV